MREWWRRFRAWAAGRQGIAEDLAEEVQSHLQMETESHIERGMAPEEARSAARRRFGNTTMVAERARDAWGFSSIESSSQGCSLRFPRHAAGARLFGGGDSYLRPRRRS